ncbi:hypothetical protein [Nocardiopsis gilva]|uniref:hypothetical protein n=1 Tax=Nocardiopsis gilva TaxID=280236 RepID=UPI001269478C|nr:hypothetical protein [Nocardiopsis gilva]
MEYSQLHIALARTAVERAAPDELPLFDVTSDAYFARRKQSRRHRNADRMLDFGVDEAVTLVSHAALVAAGYSVDYLAQRSGEAAGQVVERTTASWWKRLMVWKREPEEPTQPTAQPDDVEQPISLTRDQLAAVRELAHQRSVDAGVSDETARLIADSIVGELALLPHEH